MWFHPQMNIETKSFQNASREGLLMSGGDRVPGLTRWYNGPHLPRWHRGLAGVVDVSDRRAVDWQRSRLSAFRRSFSVTGFHVGGGETIGWPLWSSSVLARLFPDPNELTLHMARLVSSASDRHHVTVVQSAYGSQRLPSVMVRVAHGSSSWNDIGGLRSVVAGALSLGVIGYPLFVPEAVGGSAFIGPPSKELYVRWVELAAFMPVLHFSLSPDHYDRETVAIARRMIEIRQRLVIPTVLRLLSSTYRQVRHCLSDCF